MKLGLQGKAAIYQKFAPGKDDCEKVLNRLESCFM
jgi:hypothetical protein